MCYFAASSRDCLCPAVSFFFFNDTATTEIYTLSLHDALPIFAGVTPASFFGIEVGRTFDVAVPLCAEPLTRGARSALDKREDRKSTRLNSSHLVISYAVFCLKKKNNLQYLHRPALSVSTIRLS